METDFKQQCKVNYNQNSMTWDYTYELVYYIDTKRHQQIYLPSTLHLLNAIIHILIFLSLPPISMVSLAVLINSFPLFYTLIGIFSFLLAEIIVLVLRKKQFYLLQQLQIFRFLISPLLLLTTINMIKTQKLLRVEGTIISIALTLFSSLLSQYLIFQNFRLYSIKSQGVYIVTEWLRFQILLVSISSFENMSSQIVMSLILLLFSCKVLFKHFNKITNNSLQSKILYIITLLHVNISALLVIHFLLGFTFFSQIFAIFSLVTIVYQWIKIDLNLMIPIQKMRSVLELKADYSQFIELVDYFIYVYRQKNKSTTSQLPDFILSLVNQHEQQCTMPSCQFLSSNTQDQLMNLTQRSIEQLTHKVQKKIEWIFQFYYQSYSDHYQYNFDFLKFYAYCYNNRVKFQKILRSIEIDKLDWYQKYQHYKFQKKCQEIQNKESVDVARTDEVFVEIQSNMLSTLTLMQQFWAQFFQEKVDLKRIMKVATKLFPYKSKLEQLALEQLYLENFTSFKILRLYVLYLRMILNHQQMALKLEDHLKITTQKLKNSQNIKYLSMQTEVGLIVICLSESKLGNIFLVNQKACQIFKYSKKDMIQKRVNAIMPKIFAVLHDKILMDFLKIRRRISNTDQRLLFGKDEVGYMFPVNLQLQNTSFTSNDEYIFIAIVKPQKTKQIPIYCIVDHQGYIRDFTSSFKIIFYHHSKKQKIYNIQQIIPNYYDDEYKQDSITSRRLVVPMNTKKLGNIEAKFDISPIIIKGNHEGFSIKMSYTSINTQSNITIYKFSDKLMKMKEEGKLIAYQNYFNRRRIAYEISKQKTLILQIKASFQHTTMNQRELDDSFLESRMSQKIKYSAGIKTIRFIKNHFQRIEQDESFHSQSYEANFQLDIKAKIENVKQKSQKKETNALVTSFAIIINIFIILMIIDLGFIYGIYQYETNYEMNQLIMSDYDKRIRYLLPEYIIYNSLYNSKINPEYYYQKLKELQNKLIQALVQSPFSQKQKEQVYKIIIKKQNQDLQELIQSDVISVTLEDIKIQNILQVAWGIVIGGSFLLILAILFIIYKLNGTLLVVYTIFLNLNQQTIRKIYQSCKNMIKLIQYQYHETKMDEAETQQNQKDEDNQIERIKQFKNLQRSENRIYFLQMTLPLATIIIYTAAILYLNYSSFGAYQTFKTQHYNYFEAIPSTSTEFMKAILRTLYKEQLKLFNNYTFYLQQIQKNLIDFQSSNNEYDFISILYGNVCNNTLVIADNQIISCNQLQNGILTSGIVSCLNYLNQQFKKISLTTNNSPSELLSLLQLQYKFVTPIMQKMKVKMQEMLKKYIRNYKCLFQSLTLSLTGLLIFYSLYLYYFPLKNIQNQVKFTNGMIALVPQNSMNQKIMKNTARSKRI